MQDIYSIVATAQSVKLQSLMCQENGSMLINYCETFLMEKKKLKSHHNWHFFVLTLVVFIILFFRINRIFCYSNSQYSYLKKNVRNFWKTVDLLLTIIFGQRTFFSSIKLVFQGQCQFYLFYYDTIFKYRVLFKKAQSSIEIDIIVVKKL